MAAHRARPLVYIYICFPVAIRLKFSCCPVVGATVLRLMGRYRKRTHNGRGRGNQEWLNKVCLDHSRSSWSAAAREHKRTRLAEASASTAEPAEAGTAASSAGWEAVGPDPEVEGELECGEESAVYQTAVPQAVGSLSALPTL